MAYMRKKKTCYNENIWIFALLGYSYWLHMGEWQIHLSSEGVVAFVDRKGRGGNTALLQRTVCIIGQPFLCLSFQISLSTSFSDAQRWRYGIVLWDLRAFHKIKWPLVK